jgi:anti-sigma regulatory factor (Ser/Thr protein kinase)
VPEARGCVVEFARDCGFTDEQVFDIGLAVGEACANAVMHASTAESSFLVRAYDRADKIVVTVTDPGDDAMPPQLRDPDRIGGLGLFLIRRLMDRMSLDMSPGGTKLTMSRRKNAA